ncbi:MAG: hypothetical protein ACRC7S_10120 [Cetobacterium sp.]
MNITDNGGDYNVPFIHPVLADHLKAELSADRQIAMGFLRDASVVRSEGYLLGFLAGLGYGRQIIDVMLANQEGQSLEGGLRDLTDSFLNP